jgi:predicted RNase H-like nuclease (RuvC/YqgF family)
MAEQASKNKGVPEKKQDVERIREILFGSQAREYEQRFANLQRDLERLQKTLDSVREQLTEQETNHSKKLQLLRDETRQADEELRSELRESAEKLWDAKVDRSSLGDFFVELGTMLKSGHGGSVASLLQDLVETE